MDHKSFKQDLTYCCKKFQKDGKTITIYDSNLSINEDKKFFLDSESIDPLEMLVLIKGYIPTSTMDRKAPYNLSMVDVLVEQAQLARNDLYAFLDGLENVELAGPKNEFYNVGVYIREKFTPVGAREETLRLYSQNYNTKPKGGPRMKKFIVHTRAVPGTCHTGQTPVVVEVEGELISSMEDPSVISLPPGEFRFRIMLPEFLFEPYEAKQLDGSKKKIMVPTIYHSHAIYDTIELAQEAAKRMVKSELDFKVRKKKIESYSEEELIQKYSEIKELLL